MSVLQLYYESAQKRMADYHQQANDTTNRAYQLISVYMGVLTLLCGYIFINFGLSATVVSIVILAAGIAIGLVYLLRIILPRLYMPLGRSPVEMKSAEYVAYFGQHAEFNDEQRLKIIIKDELNVLQQSIVWQAEKNNRRTKMFASSLWSAIIGIVLSTISVLVIPFIL